MKCVWWLDPDLGVYEIGPLVTDGDNIITLAIAPMSIHAELEPVHLMGDFGVEPAERRWRLIPPAPLAVGDWVAAKLPFYPDRVAYTSDYSLAAGVRHFAQLPRWHGTVAEEKTAQPPTTSLSGERVCESTIMAELACMPVAREGSPGMTSAPICE